MLLSSWTIGPRCLAVRNSNEIQILREGPVRYTDVYSRVLYFRFMQDMCLGPVSSPSFSKYCRTEYIADHEFFMDEKAISDFRPIHEIGISMLTSPPKVVTEHLIGAGFRLPD